MPGTGDQPGGRNGSCVSRVLRFEGLVAKGTLLPGPLGCASARQGGTVSTKNFSSQFQEVERRSSSLPTSQWCVAVQEVPIGSPGTFSASTPSELTGKPFPAFHG